MRITSSFIHLHQLSFHTYIGVGDQERVVGNNYIVDLKLKADISKAIDTDNVSDTINYATVYEVIKKELNTPCKLLEYAAGRIGKTLLKHFPTIEAMTIILTKKNPPMGADSCGASIELHLINEKSEAENIVSLENK